MRLTLIRNIICHGHVVCKEYSVCYDRKTMERGKHFMSMAASGAATRPLRRRLQYTSRNTLSLPGTRYALLNIQETIGSGLQAMHI